MTDWEMWFFRIEEEIQRVVGEPINIRKMHKFMNVSYVVIICMDGGLARAAENCGISWLTPQ